VDREEELLELRYGNAGDEPYERWLPVALVGKPKKYVFPVSWLTDSTNPVDQKAVAAAREDLTYYLLKKGEPDPWAYAQYHCTTTANVYSPVHWSYFPNGLRRRRHSSTVIRGDQFPLFQPPVDTP
jgi:hypothetical protein